MPSKSLGAELQRLRAHPAKLSQLMAILGLIAITGVLGLPFLTTATIDWSESSRFLLVGTICFSAAIFVHGSATDGWKACGLHLFIAISIGWLAEVLGLRFGAAINAQYTYASELQPQLLGVPAFIPLAWFTCSYMPLVYLRSWTTHNSQGKLSYGRWLAKSTLCALCLTGADLMLDPLAHSVGAWHWTSTSDYFGIPLANFICWFLIGFAIYACYLPFARPIGNQDLLFDTLLVMLTEFLSLLGVIACLVHVGSPLPAILFLLTVGPFWGYWHWNNHFKQPSALGQ